MEAIEVVKTGGDKGNTFIMLCSLESNVYFKEPLESYFLIAVPLITSPLSGRFWFFLACSLTATGFALYLTIVIFNVCGVDKLYLRKITIFFYRISKVVFI